MDGEEVPRSRHTHGVPVSGQGHPRGNVTGVVLRRPQAVGRNFERRKPHPLRVRRAMTIPIKSWVIHQNRESTPNQEHQEKEVHEMGQSKPGGETMRSGRIFQIDWRQVSLCWKSGDQILSPGNRHWNESDNGKGKDEPGIDPDPKTAIRWIVDRLMDLVECLHEGFGSGANQVALIGRDLARLADGFFGVLGKTSAG